MRLFIIVVIVLHSSISNGKEFNSIMKCGVPNPVGFEVRMDDAKFIDFGEFPWLIAIIKKSDTTSSEWSDREHLSTGTLIHPAVVLANPRSIQKYAPYQLKCRAGEWDKTTNDEEYAHQERDVRKIVKHQDYFKESVWNAVSLIFLVEKFDLINTPHIGVACVGQTLPSPGARCFGTGWGNAAFTTKTNTPKKISIDLISSAECQAKLKKTRLGKFFRLHDSLTCGSSDDNCKEDHGAPLVCPIRDESTRYVLYGMSAYRIQNGAPCTYVKVPAFYNWIGQKMAEEGFNNTSYTYVA